MRLHHSRELALATIHKVLVKAKVPPLSKPRRPKVPTLAGVNYPDPPTTTILASSGRGCFSY